MQTLSLSANRHGRDFVVGDLHGQMAMLDALLAHVDFRPDRDRLISVGDLVDRGPHSPELLERFCTQPGHYALCGNHEAMLIASDRSLADFTAWQRSGGTWAVSLPLAERLRLAEQAARLPLTITLELADGRRIGIVHAELPFDLQWDEACRAALVPDDVWDREVRTISASLVWGRRRYRAVVRQQTEGHDPDDPASRSVPGVDWVICGHNIVQGRRPVTLGNCLFIDTGAYESQGRLTMVEPMTGRYWQARMQKNVARAFKRSGIVDLCKNTATVP